MKLIADIGDVFGKISPPKAIQDFGGQDATGARGISTFLSSLISLIYVFAAIALLFMLLWGAFDWIISEGDKEKINSARNKIINAIIGLILFSVAFAFLRILGGFTGFEFFRDSNSACCAPGYEYKTTYCLGHNENGNELRYPLLSTCKR